MILRKLYKIVTYLERQLLPPLCIKNEMHHVALASNAAHNLYLIVSPEEDGNKTEDAVIFLERIIGNKNLNNNSRNLLADCRNSDLL